MSTGDMAGNTPSRNVQGLELQTPGAGPSRCRLPSVPIPLPHAYTLKKPTTCFAPTGTSTMHEDLELGLLLRRDSNAMSTPSTPSGGSAFARQRSAATVADTSKVSPLHKRLFLANPAWQTDMITFCSYARADSAFGDARITHIQARKSYQLPFMHEYLLVFFIAPSEQRFVMRIDRLGKAGSRCSSGPATQQEVTVQTAIQEVGIYYIQDSQTAVDRGRIDAPWFKRDGRWGSRPVATLAAWDALDPGEHVSHHIQTAALSSSQTPRLKDVSRLLEAILLEMPTYNLTTTNCYMMTRSSLLLLQRCHPSAFACYLGEMSSELTPASALAEPVWAGLMRWYLPFVVLFLLIYLSLLMVFYGWAPSKSCMNLQSSLAGVSCHSDRLIRALGYAIRSVLNVPVPVGAMHAYMTSLEVEMNKLVVNISAQILPTGSSKFDSESTPSQPFGVMFDSAWAALGVWWVVGCMFAICVFVTTAFEYGILVSFCVLLILCVWFNFKFSDSSIGMSSEDDRRNIDDILGLPVSGE